MSKNPFSGNVPGLLATLRRRAFLKMAPAALVAGAVPAAAACTVPLNESPAMAFLYDRWLAAKNAYNDNDFDEKRDAELYSELRRIEDEILSIRPQTVGDYAYKLIVLNDFETFEGIPWGNAMLAEAYALTGRAPVSTPDS